MAHYRAYAVRFDGNFDGYESLKVALTMTKQSAKRDALRITALLSFGAANASLPEWNASRSKAELTRYLLTLVINAPSPPSLGSYR